MNKTELVNAIAARTGQTASGVSDALSAFEKAVTEAVASGEKVTLPGFLIFDRTERAARVGRNPATGATLNIPAAVLPRVKVGKTFKDAISAS